MKLIKKNISEQILKEYFFFKYSIILEKELHNSDKTKNDETIKHSNDSFIELKRDINTKTIPENKNSSKKLKVDEKILKFNKK